MTTNSEDQVPPIKQRRKRCCLLTVGAILLVIFLLFIIILILALTVFKTKQPETQLQSAKVEGVAPSVSLPAVNIQLNLSLDLQILVTNPNHASFKHGTGNSVLLYRNNQVGNADIYPGLIPASGSSTLSCRLTIQLDQFATDFISLISDIIGGAVVMKTRTNIPGRVNFLGILKKHIVSLSDCQFTINFLSMNITEQECHNKAKF